MKTTSIKITDSKYLVAQEVDKTKIKEMPKNIHHIWIRDRSGSMSGTLSQLMEDLYNRIKQLPVGDIISVGWFSGKNEFGWDVVGFKITDGTTDFKFLKSQLNKNRHTIGLTCYTDILKDAKNAVITKYNMLLDNFSLMFMTDGYPNVDEGNIIKVAKELEPLVASCLIVGYGNYYNKEMLSQIAENIGGSVSHSSSLAEFSVQLHEFISDSLESERKIPIKLTATPDVLFSINGTQIVQYKQDLDGILQFTPTRKNTDYVFYSSNTPVGKIVDEITEETIKNRKSSVEFLVKGLYGYSYLLSNKTKIDEALTVLSNVLGDVEITNKINNSFTNEEYGTAEDRIRNAMAKPSTRLTEGFNKNYLPDENAFCVIDLIELLQNEKETYFLPRHKNWSYNRIGIKTESVSTGPKFYENDNPKIPLESLIWNKELLNLSVGAQLYGHIEFTNEDYAKHSFQKNYKTHVFRNYSIVKDGFLNVKNLVVQLSNDVVETIDKLNPRLLTKLSSVDEKNSIYDLNLSLLPVMNRGIGKRYRSATEVCKLSHQELMLQAENKVFNFYKNEIEETVSVPSLLTEEQQEFLKSQGITYNGFSSETVKAEPVDFYMAKTFQIKIQGFSSLPNIKAVLEKKQKIETWDGKGKQPKYTVSEQAMLTAYNKYLTVKSMVPDQTDRTFELSLIKNTLGTNKKMLALVRGQLQRMKFAVLLGKTWFEEFTSRDNNQLTINMDSTDYTFEFVIGEKQIYF